ncbi:cytochrome c [Hoeflea marina]|uniref:Cytochrome c n=1 Tax=Hoeflea marina TaxID=274592 RepID=A0A317PDA7_9HYPH|nr:cytochrome c family protein [Hoeflea marina]PWV97529.1 cytochrome c [Hoeflea marina]
MSKSLSFILGMALSAGLALTSAARADGDAVEGAKVFKKCAACHTASEPKNRVGPHLVGIVGRGVASVADYKYSKAMADHTAEVPVWTVEALDAYLRSPKGVVKGTKMAFAGLKKDEDVANVIAYLTDPSAAN